MTIEWLEALENLKLPLPILHSNDSVGNQSNSKLNNPPPIKGVYLLADG